MREAQGNRVSNRIMNRHHPLIIVAVLTVVNILNYLDRNLVQAVRPAIDASWHLSQLQSGFFVSAFVIGYALFSPVAGILAHQSNRPRLLTAGLCLWSICTVATGVAPGPAPFVAARIGVGIGEALFVTVAATYLRDLLVDPIRITRAFSLFYAAIPVGSALGYVVGGWVANRASWQAAFYVGAVPGFLLAPVVALLPNLPNDCQSRSSKDSTDDQGMSNRLGPIKEVLRSRAAVGIIAGYVANTFALAGVAANVSSHGTSLGYTLEQIGVLFGGTLVIAGFLGTIGGGWLCSFLARAALSREVVMLRFCAVTALVGAPLLVVGFETSSRELFITLCFFAELFIFAGTAPINSLLVTVVPPHLVGAAQGLCIASINILGSFLAPIVVGFVADTVSLRWGLHLCAVALVLSGVGWWATSQRATFGEDRIV